MHRVGGKPKLQTNLLVICFKFQSVAFIGKGKAENETLERLYE